MENVLKKLGVQTEEVGQAERIALVRLQQETAAALREQEHRQQVAVDGLESQLRLLPAATTPESQRERQALLRAVAAGHAKLRQLSADARLAERRVEVDQAAANAPRHSREQPLGTVLLSHDDQQSNELVRTGQITPFEAIRRADRLAAEKRAMLVVPSSSGRATLTTEAEVEERAALRARRLREEAERRKNRALAASRKRFDSALPSSSSSSSTKRRVHPEEEDVEVEILDDSEPILQERPSTQASNPRREQGGKKKRPRNNRRLPSPPREVEEKGDDSDSAVDITDDGMRVPRHVLERLFDYQETCLKWLWELHMQGTGGILGDEMGLGKTVQVLAFLSALRASNQPYRPSLVLAPATVLMQWRREADEWCRGLRHCILHESSGEARAQQLQQLARNEVDFVITTYQGFFLQQEELQAVRWAYVVLDEGHKIRNPEAQITVACKRLRTPHRLLLSGSPIQNNLVELWSLFDFVFPGRLGTLPVFRSEFAMPIARGGFANSSALQVQTAYECALALREQIRPYMLRRLKADVKLSIPGRSERMLFCPLAASQREAYERYMSSREARDIFDGRMNMLAGITQLRKICNHAALSPYARGMESGEWADWSLEELLRHSGKMKVLDAVLRNWLENDGHRVLLFTQGRQMLDILERYVRLSGFSYLRMDGTTSIRARMGLIDQFNDPNAVGGPQLFLLTTRVGGLGTNLVGADRVVIFDPDWNPSTDLQARERAWRIGQTREVSIFRLLTKGSIEERIYHRQIFKQYLTHKVLKDPKHRRFLKDVDPRDLFRLDSGDISDSAIFFPEASMRLDAGGDPSESAVPPTALLESELRRDVEAETDPQSTSKQDDWLIKALLKSGSGLHSALSHDAVMAEGQDEALLRVEASKKASEAVDALERSFLSRQSRPVYVPTWTGSVGSAGVDPPVAAFNSSSFSRPPAMLGSAPSSAELLANLTVMKGSALQSSELPSEVRNLAVDQDMLGTAELLVQYLRLGNGHRTTAELGAFLRANRPNEHPERCKQLLMALAAFSKAEKTWFLRDRFLSSSQRMVGEGVEFS